MAYWTQFILSNKMTHLKLVNQPLGYDAILELDQSSNSLWGWVWTCQSSGPGENTTHQEPRALHPSNQPWKLQVLLLLQVPVLIWGKKVKFENYNLSCKIWVTKYYKVVLSSIVFGNILTVLDYFTGLQTGPFLCTWLPESNIYCCCHHLPLSCI